MTQDGSPSPPSPTTRRNRRLAMVAGGLSVVAACVAIRCYWGAESANADPSKPRDVQPKDVPPKEIRATPVRSTRAEARASRTAAAAGSSRPRIVATVNGTQITRSDLARECLRHYGEEVLESLVNKLLIAQECKQRKIVVTRAEVDAEVERLAQRFGLPKNQWLKMLKKERGITPAQYASDIIWPTLALRRLAGERLKVTREETIKAYEMKYGPRVRARLIACNDLKQAQKLRAAAVAHPDEFGDLAKDHSEDASASFKGLIEPIRKHGTYPELEQAAFTMADGAISKVIPAGGQYVILKREGLLPAQKVSYEEVAGQLEEMVRDRKLRSAAQDIFRQLQDRAVVEDVWNDPQKRRQMPGVAAVINGQRITVSQLAEECIKRHGPEVLEGVISRRLLELACQKHQVTVTEAEIDREIVRMAEVSVEPKADGSPDVDAYLKLVTQRQGISVEVYRRDWVWPSVALKKLVGEKVQVTDEDLQKGYEANYGPRVRCRAIVLNDLRRAQRVWQKAWDHLTAEYFGELAAQYSVEPGSRALRGEVPPIHKHGGQPLLEKEAFLLKPGELSGVIQVSRQFVILFCEGRTKPTGVGLEEVRDEIYQHIYEKKRQLAMAKYVQQLHEAATIDNYLANTSHSPKKAAERKPARGVPTFRQVPGRR